MEIKLSKLQFWSLIIGILTPLIIVLVWGVELKASTVDIKDMKGAQIQTMVTVAVQSENIKSLTEQLKRDEEEMRLIKDDLKQLKSRQDKIYARHGWE